MIFLAVISIIIVVAIIFATMILLEPWLNGLLRLSTRKAELFFKDK